MSFTIAKSKTKSAPTGKITGWQMLGRKNRFFESTLENIAKTMARKYNLRVIIKGNQCCTDGTTIYLPMMEDVPEELYQDMNGFLNHEVAHVKYTDFKDIGNCINAFHRYLHNALEDSRIEILLPREYNGTKLSLERLNYKWRAKQDAVRSAQPWPIQLVTCIREIFDNRPVKSNERIQPLVDAVYPYVVKLRGAKSSVELRIGTEEIIRVINKTRELLAKDLPELTEEEKQQLEELMQAGLPMQETPIPLDPNRDEKEAKQAQTQQELLDPATQEKKTESGDGEPQDGEEAESKEGDGEQKSDGIGKKENAPDEGTSKANESHSEAKNKEAGDGDETEDGNASESENGENDSAGESADEGDADSEGDGETGSAADGEENDSAGESAEGENAGANGDEDGDGASQSDAGANGDEDGDGASAGAGDKTDGDFDEMAGADSEMSGDDSDGDAGSANNASISAEQDGTEKAQHGKTNPSGMPKPSFKPSFPKWEETDTEREMAEQKHDGGEWDKHVFSPESYMKERLEEHFEAQPDAADVKDSMYMDADGHKYGVSLPLTKAYDRVIVFDGKGDAKKYHEELTEVMPHIIPIKQQFERELIVRENRRWVGQQERGFLNTRDLAKLATDPNYKTPFKVFKRTDTSDVAVTILIDCSGSMGWNNKMRTARMAAIALAEALKSINIACEVLGFNTADDSKMSAEASTLSRDERKRFNRLGDRLEHFVFKSFDCQSLVGISNAEADGCNADGESIAWAAQRLALRKEKRKILMVLSDGQPSYDCESHDLLAGDLRRVIKQLPQAGIEPIGVGILTRYPEDFYPNNVIVENLSELSTTVVKSIVEMLRTEGLKLGHTSF